MESYARGGPPALDSSTRTLEFGGPYIEVGVVVVVGDVVVVVVGDVVVVVVGDVVVVVVGDVVVVVGDVVVVVVGPGVSTKYAAIPAMMRITTMTMTVVVVLIALCLMIFILVFRETPEIIKGLAVHETSQIQVQSAPVEVPSYLSIRRPIR